MLPIPEHSGWSAWSTAAGGGVQHGEVRPSLVVHEQRHDKHHGLTRRDGCRSVGARPQPSSRRHLGQCVTEAGLPWKRFLPCVDQVDHPWVDVHTDH